MAKVVHYAMENNWNDEGGLYNGTAIGTPSFSGDAAVGSYSGSFDGSASYIDIGNSSNLIPPNMSITGWVKINPVGVGAERAILARWDTVGGVNQRCFILTINSDSKLIFKISNDGIVDGTPFISDGSITSDIWTFISITWNGSEIKGYINAIENGSPLSHTGMHISTNPTGIGAIPGRGIGSGDPINSRFYGLLDDIRIYNETLTPNQIADIYGLPQYTVTYNAGPNGSITGDTIQTVYEGFESTEVTAIPDVGYFFDQWDDGILTASRTDTITGDLTVEAQFSDTTILKYSAGPNGSLTGNISQTVGYGDNGTEVIAVPDPDFEFLEWSDGVLTASRIDLNITAPINVIAYFRHIPYGSYAYIACRLNQFPFANKTCIEIIDINDISNPFHLSSFIFDGHAGPILNAPDSLFLKDNYLYVTGNNTLIILDVADPSIPIYKGSFIESIGTHGFTDIFVKGSYAYVCSWGSWEGAEPNGLRIIDISDPTAPVQVAFLQHGDGGAILQRPKRIKVINNYAYILALTSLDDGVIEIVDISNPLAPVHKSSIVNNPSGPILINSSDMDVLNNHVYVCSDGGTPDFEIINVSNPSSPTHVSFLPTSITASVSIEDNYAFVTNWSTSKLHCYDVSNPILINEISSIAIPGVMTFSDVVSIDNKSFVVSYDTFTIYDFSNPTVPKQVFTIADGEGGALLKGAWRIVTNYSSLVLTSIVPDRGSVQGGTIVTITGTGFGNSPGYAKIGEKRLEILSWSDTQIRAVTPSNEPGTYDVLIYNNSGLVGVF